MVGAGVGGRHRPSMAHEPWLREGYVHPGHLLGALLLWSLLLQVLMLPDASGALSSRRHLRL